MMTISKGSVYLLAIAFLIGCSDSRGNADSSQCRYDSELGFDTRDCVLVDLDAGIVINELTSDNEDQIELFNPSDEAVLVGGWVLTDQVSLTNVDEYDPLSDDGKFVFPAGTVLAPGAYVVISKGSGALEHPFGIAKAGDVVSLLGPNGILIDQVQFGDGDATPSYCRVPDGEADWQKCEATFSTPNTPFQCGNGVLDEGEVCDGDNLGDATCSGVNPVFSGGDISCSTDCRFQVEACISDAPCDSQSVALNEVCHKNSSCGVDGTTTGDWVELYNHSDAIASISGCYIQVIDNGVLQRRVLIGSLPEFNDETIGPGEFWLVSGNGTLFKAGKDEEVSLLDAEQTQINTLVTSSALRTDGAVQEGTCRIDDGSAQPSPGASNACPQ